MWTLILLSITNSTHFCLLLSLLLLFIFIPSIYIFLGYLDYVCQIRFLFLILSISYFLGFVLIPISRNHILAENSYFKNQIEWAEHKIIDLKPAYGTKLVKNVIIQKTTLTDDFKHHPFLYWVKFFENIISYRTKNKKLQRQDN